MSVNSYTTAIYQLFVIRCSVINYYRHHHLLEISGR